MKPSGFTRVFWREHLPQALDDPPGADCNRGPAPSRVADFKLRDPSSAACPPAVAGRSWFSPGGLVEEEAM